MGGTIYTPSEDTWGALGWSTNSESGELVGLICWIGEWNAFNDPASTWGATVWEMEIVSLTAPDAISSKVSAGSAWGDDTWGEEQGWGQFVLNPADVMGVTGVSSTSSVGSVSFTIDATASVTGVASTSSVGSLSPADVMGFTGVSSTSSVGSVTVADVVGLTGVSATFNVGSISIGSSPVVNLSGQQATVSVGSIDPLAIVQGITGQSITSGVGSVTVADLVLGISGVEATASCSCFWNIFRLWNSSIF